MAGALAPSGAVADHFPDRGAVFRRQGGCPNEPGYEAPMGYGYGWRLILLMFCLTALT